MLFRSGKIELCSDEAKRKWNVSPLPEYVPVNGSVNNGQYPLVLLTPNAGNRIHSQFGNLQIIKENSDDPALLISPLDAEERKILSGRKIRVFNEYGELYCRVQISNRMPAGSVVLPNGIWINEGGGGNLLIAGQETDMGYGAAFHDNMVEVEIAD